MKNIILFFFSFSLTFVSFSQNAKIIVGGGVSKIHNTAKLPILDESVFVFSAGLGVDVLERERFYLSNEIGYLQMGGKEDISELLPPFNELFFIGLGPKLSVSVDSDPLKNTLYADGYKIEKLVFGVNGEIGYMHDWDNYRVGITGSYLLNVNRIGYSIANDLKSNPIYFNLSFGYDFM